MTDCFIILRGGKCIGKVIGGPNIFNLYLEAYLWSGVDPPRGQGHMAGKGTSTQVMTSSHTYDVISNLEQCKRGNDPRTFHI